MHYCLSTQVSKDYLKKADEIRCKNLDEVLELYELNSQATIILRVSSKIDKSLIALYNVYVLGTILYDSFVNYEAINRITRYFYAFWIFPFALILFYRKSFYKESSLQLAYIISFGVFIHFFRYLFLKGDQTLFLWDI